MTNYCGTTANELMTNGLMMRGNRNGSQENELLGGVAKSQISVYLNSLAKLSVQTSFTFSTRSCERQQKPTGITHTASAVVVVV